MNDQIKQRQGDSLNVFIVEDSYAVRESLYAMLSKIFGVAVVGFAVDEAGAIEGIDTLLPDVVIIDPHLRNGSGLNILLNIKKFHAAIKVIVLSNYANESHSSFIRCRLAGADYLFDKSLQFMLIETVLDELMSASGLNGDMLA